jgi:hypothetical protein
MLLLESVVKHCRVRIRILVKKNMYCCVNSLVSFLPKRGVGDKQLEQYSQPNPESIY